MKNATPIIIILILLIVIGFVWYKTTNAAASAPPGPIGLRHFGGAVPQNSDPGGIAPSLG